MTLSGLYWILDDDGEPFPVSDVLVWGEWFQGTIGKDARRVAFDIVAPDGVEVSTVFLGLDHNFGAGRPLLWETMIFGGSLDGACSRYASRADALAGHAAALEAARAAAGDGTPPDEPAAP